ncbi:DUF2058 domain-containing protein [Oceaniserpentilla sp. 4NH20-0058]|uniref:DUF2058 domain-containing protein n=1 Tax=Oceaniserpentilla sp. 4NH20-0058 TaxID=3127660 RepID=UPI00310BAAA2
MASLQEQLLKAGLTNKKKAQQAERAKKKVAKQIRKGEDVVDEAKAQAEKARLAKLEKDKQLNEERKAQEHTKALAAQIKQLVHNHAINLENADVDYNFTDGKKVKRIQVTPLLQHQLSRGMLAIAKLDQSYFVIPGVVADKIRERNDSFIVYQADISQQSETDDEDPYADYQIPDDLMW